jgi:thymidylate synthase ThyX
MKIKIVDDLNPEEVAMLQALYSRSAESVETHLAKVSVAGSGKFMDNYVVGYNHKSIADCGTTTLFFEGVSLLAAKAIQDHPLYSGQETSTRYIDMAKQPVIDPVLLASLDDRGAAVIKRWMSFYTKHQNRVAATVRARHPRMEEDKEVEYERAIKARTFDIMRGFLPAGITTQLSWHTNLRQAGDHLTHLENHPSPEIHILAKEARAALHAKYPSSGLLQSLPSVSGVSSKSAEEAIARAVWEERAGKSFTYGRAAVVPGFGSFGAEALQRGVWDLLKDRPRGCVVPHFVAAAGNLCWSFPLDFGSFRDLQRHRNGVCRMPLLTTQLGFEPWYLEQLDAELRVEAIDLIDTQTSAIEGLSGDPVRRQYYTALGFRVGCYVTYSLPAAIYVMEMRSAKTVHPTLRRVVLGEMVPLFRAWFPDVALHVDESPDDWTVRRGRQTITEKIGT